MPQIQTINTARQKPEPSQIQQFFSRLGKDYKDKEDQVEIGNLIGEYQRNREQANAFEDLQLGLEKSNVSPSKRLQAQEQLNAIRKNTIEKDKLLNSKVEEQVKLADKKKKEDAEALEKTKKAEEAAEKTVKTKNEVKEILLNSGEVPEEAERLSGVLSPASANARARDRLALQKNETKKTEKQEAEDKEKAVTQKAFNQIANLVPKAGKGTGILSVFGGENAKTLGEFTSLTGALESLLVDKVSRGTLSNTRFNYIKDTLLPKATDTQAEIKGKLKGLATILELDATELDNLENKKSKKKEEAKVPEGKVRVRNKETGQTGNVTPYPGMEAKYDTITE